jgi:ribosomal protein S8
MAMTDPLGDMLTRIRNGQQARKDSILTPASRLRANVLDVLQREGYIRGYSEEVLAGQKGCASTSNISRASRRSTIWRASRSRAAASTAAPASCRTSATALGR